MISCREPRVCLTARRKSYIAWWFFVLLYLFLVVFFFLFVYFILCPSPIVSILIR